jgi:hypothetical protein
MYSSGDNLCMIIWVSKMMKPERRKEQLSMLSSTYITKFFCENNATVTVVLPYTFQVNLEGHNTKKPILFVSCHPSLPRRVQPSTLSQPVWTFK